MADRALRTLVVLSVVMGLLASLGPGASAAWPQSILVYLGPDFGDWLLYEDSNYGFAIRYPSGWFLYPTTSSHSGDIATIASHPVYDPSELPQSQFAKVEIGVLLHDKPLGQRLEDWAAPTEWMLPFLVEQSELVINGISSVQQVYERGEFLISTAYIPRGTKVYFVTITVSSPGAFPEVQAILQSFEFIAPYDQTQNAVEHLYPKSSSRSSQAIVATAPAGFRLPCDGSYAISNGPREGLHSREATEAIDLVVPGGTPIRATEAGNVAFVDWDGSGYGLTIMLHHDNGMDSWYAHLKEIQVSLNDRPSRGEQIALSGNTGCCGYHLHFHVKRGSDPVCIRDLSGVWWNTSFPPGNSSLYSGCGSYPPSGSPPSQCRSGARALSCPSLCGITLYEHANWDGRQRIYALRDTWDSGPGFSASSLGVAPDWAVVLYAGPPNTDSPCILFDHDVYNFQDYLYSDRSPVNDRVRSVRVFHEVCPSVCYNYGLRANASGELEVAAPQGICGGPPPPPPPNHPPNTPSPQSPHDWYVSHDGRAPTLCWNNPGDPDGDPLEFYAEVYDSAVNANSGWTNNTCWRPGDLDGRYYGYQWHVKARDNRGGESGWSTTWHFNIEAPNNPPSISFDTANGNSFSSGRIESRDRTWIFQGAASDPEGQLNRVEFRCSGDNCGSGPGQTTGTNWSLTRTDMAGQNDVYFMAYDNPGNSTPSRHLDLSIDLAPPTTWHNLAGTMGENGWYVSPVVVQLHADDGNTGNARVGVQEIRYRVDSGGWQTASGADARFTVNGDGNHTVTYYAVDRIGNVEGQRQATFKIDATRPTAPGAATETHGAVSGQWQRNWNDPNYTWGPASDATSGVSHYHVKWSNLADTWITAPAYDPPPVPTGEHQLRVYARDAAGNVGPEGPVFTFRYDGTPPHAPEVQNNDNVASGVWQKAVRTANFSWPVPLDEGSGIAGYNVYWGPDPAGTSSTLRTSNTYVNTTPICATDRAATYYLRVRSQDNVGWQSGWVAYALAYDGAPPTARLIANYGMDVANQTNIHLDIVANDEGSGVTRMRLSNDARTWSDWMDVVEETYWEIPAIGRRSHAIYLQVVDGAGNVSDVVSDSVYLDVNRSHPRSERFWLWDEAMPAGGAAASSARYRLRTSVGQPLDSPRSTSSSYILRSGFQAGALAAPTQTPTYTTYFQIGYVIASGGAPTPTLRSAHYWMYGTLGQPAHVRTITSTHYIIRLGFWGGAGTDVEPPAPPLPPPPPPPECEFYSLAINGGAPFTNRPDVTLNLCGPDPVDVMLSNTPGFSGAAWQPYTQTVGWTLAISGPSVQSRFVYARFRDTRGAVHGDFFDDIIYDPNAPAGEAVFDPAHLLPGMVLQNSTQALQAISEDSTELFISAADDSSGLAQMQVSLAPDFAGAAWGPYSAIVPVTFTEDGEQTVYVRIRDRSGNVSEPSSDSLIVDTTPPIGAASVVEGVVGPRTISVTVAVPAIDNATGVSQVRISARQSFSDTLWQPYVPQVAVPISYTGEVQPVLYVQFRDGAGNASQVYSMTYLVDIAPPVLYVEVGPGATLTRPVTVLAYDELADLGRMWLSNDPLMLDGVATMPYTSTVTWAFDERRVVWVQLADSVGNVGEPYPAYAAEWSFVYLPLVLKNR